MRQSHSHLKLFAACPSAEYAKYHMDLPETTSDDAERGSREHRVFYDYGVYCEAAGVATDLDYLRGRLGTDEDLEIYEKFADTHAFDFTVPNHFEAVFDVWVDDHEFRSIIDHIEDRGELVVISDFKTDHKIRPQSEVEKDLQLRRYAVVASKVFTDAREFRCRMDFVRHGVVREVTYDLGQVAEFELQLIADIEQVENATEWPATPGTQCDWCSYTKGCPAVEAENIDVVTNAEQAVAAAAQFIVLEARRAVVKAPLAEWCNVEGAVTTNGKDVGYFAQLEFAYPDLEKVKAVCEEHGQDYTSFLKADASKLKKAGEKDPAFGEALAAIAVNRSKSVFKSKKAVPA